MGKVDFLYSGFVSRLQYEPTSCQEGLLRKVADFVSSDESDILVVNGYAGTGKTTIISSLVKTLPYIKKKAVLLAPTGRAAKVMSFYSGRPALTIHKKIYRKKNAVSFQLDFALAENLHEDTLFIIDESSMISN